MMLESKIKIAIMAVVQVNGDIWFNMLYNDNETEIAKSKRKLLRKVKRYLVENYDLAKKRQLLILEKRNNSCRIRIV